MKTNAYLALTGCLVALILCGCGIPQSAQINRQAGSSQSIVNTNANVDENREDNFKIENEIISCLPQEIYKNETFTIVFSKPHGQNFAIYHEKTKDFYFLTAGNPYYPQIDPAEFKEHESLGINTSEVLGRSDSYDASGYNKPNPYFTKTGWYRVIIGHQALDVDFIDMPVTGSCRIYYVNKPRPKAK